MHNLLNISDVHVVRNKIKILSNISFQINNHDFITIIGPNGAGKSMLLKCLIGFYPPSSGQIIRHHDLKIGYVPQRLSVENTLPIKVKKFLRLNKSLSSNEFHNVIHETQIDTLLDKQMFVLSGGEMQRVLLARALMGNPNLLVLDEPAQNLDLIGQVYFYKLLEKIYNQRNISILMVSHDLHLVMSCTKTVICLYNHICCSGTPQSVAKDPEFISLFGTDMSNMMSIYHHHHNHTHHDNDTHTGCHHD